MHVYRLEARAEAAALVSCSEQCPRRLTLKGLLFNAPINVAARQSAARD